VLIGGACTIGRKANVGLGTALHQGLVVGAGAMIGMQSAVTSHRLPFSLSMGVPARTTGANRVGLARAGYDEQTIGILHYWLREGDPAEPPRSLPASIREELTRFRVQVQETAAH